MESDDNFIKSDELELEANTDINANGLEPNSENLSNLNDNSNKNGDLEAVDSIDSMDVIELEADIELDDDLPEDVNEVVSDDIPLLNQFDDGEIQKEEWDGGYEQQELADALKMVEDFSSLVALKDALQKDLIETKGSLDKALRTNKELDNKSKHFEEHGRLADELRRDLSYVEEERNSALKNCQDLEFELNNLKSLSQRLTRDLEERDDLESTLLNLQERTALLEKEKTSQIEILEEQILALTKNNDKAEDELSVIMEEHETLKATDESLNIELKTSQGLVKQLSYEKDHLTNRVKTLEKEKLIIDSQLTQVSRKVNNRESENFMLQKSLTELRKELADTKSEKVKLSRELDVARKSFLELKGKLVNVMGSKEISGFI